ncbi:acyltransferase family protein [Desulfomicrobium baculatum]|uniref:acyltransferase family protein n=1 Tax=Desulfomicrobium baculatum TaxID=899 RepID=UPI00019E24DA
MKGFFFGYGIYYYIFVLVVIEAFFFIIQKTHPKIVTDNKRLFIFISALLAFFSIIALHFLKDISSGLGVEYSFFYYRNVFLWSLYWVLGFSSSVFIDNLSRVNFVLIFLFYIALTTCMLAIKSFFPEYYSSYNSFPQVFYTIGTILLFFKIKPKIKVLCWLGKKSYGIYLSHILLVHTFIKPLSSISESSQWIKFLILYFSVIIFSSVFVFVSEKIFRKKSFYISGTVS